MLSFVLSIGRKKIYGFLNGYKTIYESLLFDSTNRCQPSKSILPPSTFIRDLFQTFFRVYVILEEEAKGLKISTSLFEKESHVEKKLQNHRLGFSNILTHKRNFSTPSMDFYQ